MKFSTIRQGYVDGSPWIARVAEPMKACRVSLEPSMAGLEVVAKLIFDEDVGSNVLDADDTDEVLLHSLGRAEIFAETPKTVALVVWASTSLNESILFGETECTAMVTGALSADELGVLSFEAVFQISELALDAESLMFGDCSERSSHLREFTIRNLRNTRLHYQISASSFEGEGGEEKELTLSFYDDGRAIKSGSILELPGKSFTRIHAALKPYRLGQRTWMISVENERNSRNKADIFVRANVFPSDGSHPLQSPAPSMLDVCDLGGRPLNGGSVNFGDDCYVGIVVSRRLLMRNQDQVPIDVSLICPDAQSAGNVAMVDASNIPIEFPGQPSDYDHETDVSSPRPQNSSVTPFELEPTTPPVLLSETGPSDNMAGSQFMGDDDDSKELDSSEEPRGRSDTASSLMHHRASLTSLSSPSTNPAKRRVDSDGNAGGSKTDSLPPRDRKGSQESLGSTVKIRAPTPPPSKVGYQQEPQFRLPPNEAIRLEAGEEREIVVYYLPKGPVLSTPQEVVKTTRKFFKHSFRLTFVYSPTLKAKQTKTIQGEAKACESLVSGEPAIIKFGDCLILNTHTRTVTLQNHSEVEAFLRFDIQSKAVKVDPARLSIEPRGTAQVTITFTPQSVNPNYSKEITCINRRNESNRIVITIFSSNVDLNNFAYHAHYYQLVAFEHVSSENSKEFQLREVDFTNSPTFFPATLLDGQSVRRFGVRNLRPYDLALSFRYGDEIQVLAPSTDFREGFDKLMASFEHASSTKFQRHSSDVVDSAEKRLLALRDAQSQAKLRKVTTARFVPNGFQTFAVVFRPTSAKRSGLGGCLVYDGSIMLEIEMTEFFTGDLEKIQDARRWTFANKTSADEKAEEEQQSSMSYSNATTKTLRKIYATTPNAASSAAPLDDLDGLEALRLASNITPLSTGAGWNAVPTNAAVTKAPTKPSLSPFALRKVPLRATVAKSIMKLSQSHFSFGAVSSSWERKHATATLFNLCAIPLLFRLEKRNASSLPSCVDLSEDSMAGVVPPFGSENINLLFVPRTWRGKIIETIVIKNIIDSTTLDIVVKADVSIPEHFKVECEELEFGPCFPGITTNSPRFITLTNTTKKSREIVIQVSPTTHSPKWPKGHVPVFCFHLFPPQSGEAPQDVVSAQERNELLERQIRIATRKGDHEKVALLSRKLATLAHHSKSEGEEAAARLPRLSPVGPLKGSVLVSIPPLSIVKVAMWLHVRLMISSAAYHGEAVHSPGLRIYESKQGDQVVKMLSFSCEVFSNKQEYLKATGSSPVLPTASLGSPLVPPLRGARSSSLSFSSKASPDQAASHEMASSSSSSNVLHPVAEDDETLTTRRQIEVGTQTINQWFSFFVELACPSTPILTPPSSPGEASDVIVPLSSSADEDDYEFEFLVGEGSTHGGKKKLIEMKYPTEVMHVSGREGRKQIKVEAKYLRGGRHHTTLILSRKKSSTGDETREEWVIKGQASYLIIDPPLLDFGNMVVTPVVNSVERDQPFTLAVPIKIIRVIITNTHSEAVLVSTESNSNQVVVTSAAASEQVDRVLLESNQKMEVDVSVKPSLLADAWKGMCRSLKGGVVVTCETGSEDNRDTTHVARFQNTVHLTGVVGMSVFSAVEQRGPGVVRITNKSDKLPLRVEALSDVDDVKFTPGPTLELAPATDLDVTVRTTSGTAGLVFRDVILRNLDSGEVQRLAKVACALTTNDVLRIEKGFGVRVAVPVRKKNKEFVVAHDAYSDEPVRVRNISDKRLKIIMKCGYLTAGGPVEEQDPPHLSGTDVTPVTQALRPSPTSPTAKWRSNDLIARAEASIPAGNHRDVLFKFPRDSRLVQGSFRGWLTFETRSGNEECAAAVKFQGEAQVSHFDVDRTKADAGEFGAINKWEARTVELARVVNTESFVPADVEVSLETIRDFIKIAPIKPRFHVEPGTLGQTILGTVQVVESAYRAAFPGSSTAMDFETTIKLSNALNVENELFLSVSVRVCPKRFVLEKEGRELTSDLGLPSIDYQATTPILPVAAQSPPDAASPMISSTASVVSGGESMPGAPTPGPPLNSATTQSVNEWLSVINTSNVSELILETNCSTSVGAEVSMVMVFRSTGAPVPPMLKLQPGERTNIRVVLRVEPGCSLRGDVHEFGKVEFTPLFTSLASSSDPEEAPSFRPESSSLRIFGRINGPSLIRVPPENKRWDLRPNEMFTGQVFNDTRTALKVIATVSDESICELLVEEEENDSHKIDAKAVVSLLVPPFGSTPFKVIGRKLGLARIKFECDPMKPQGSAQAEVLVDYFPVLSSVTGSDDMDSVSTLATSRASPTTPARKSSTTSSFQQGPSIVGATFVSEPGLYEIDAGILTEPRTWTLTCPTLSASNEVILAGAGSKSGEWITMKRLGPDSIQVKLTPQYFGDTGGFFAAYLIIPGEALVRIKMEVVMRDTDDIAPTTTTTEMATPTTSQLPFDVSPKQIVAGALFAGRHRAFPFSLFNRHPNIPLVFQLTVSGVQGGLQVWFSFAQSEEEHRRVTVMPRSCVRLALNVLAPLEQTEDWTDLELNVACRHLRNSRVALNVALPKRASMPHFSLSGVQCQVGQSIRVLPSSFDEGEVVFIGPEWVSCSVVNPLQVDSPGKKPLDTRLNQFGLIRCRAKAGDYVKFTQASSPGMITCYSLADANDFLTVRVHLGGDSVVVPAGGASMWRDAIEIELARACVHQKFVCPPDIVFREICELLTRDPGGRGLSIAALYFRLRFGEMNMDESMTSKKEMQLGELKSLPEGLLHGFGEL